MFAWQTILAGHGGRGFNCLRSDYTSDAGSTAPATTLAMIAEAQAAGLRPLVIISQPEHLPWLPEGLDYELRNEPDLNGPSPPVYTELVLKAAEIARGRRQKLWIGAVSNLNTRGELVDHLPAQRWPDRDARESVRHSRVRRNVEASRASARGSSSIARK